MAKITIVIRNVFGGKVIEYL